ncbi:MAG: GGDEF domain-containing protein [Arenimonas sp.]|nr:GGDEF domain-containing protein [Arenimonas sp.]
MSPLSGTVRTARGTAFALVAAAAPACAAAAPATLASPGALWFVLGLVFALALAMVVCRRLISRHIASRVAWQGYAAAVALLLVVAPWLQRSQPLAALALALLLAAWGLLLVARMAGRMRLLLQDHEDAHAQARQAQRNSERDALTGALNRGAWRQRLDQQLSDALESTPRPLSVLFFDIDLFKLVNDSLGHGVGDDCLRAVASTVAAELRGGDVLGRLGGEEFAVALPGARRVNAIAVGERIRMAVQQHCRVVGEEVVELTVSIGAAEWQGRAETMDALMDRADRAMYTAKHSGRNLVVADGATASPI